MMRFRKNLRLAIAAGLALAFFSFSFPFGSQKIFLSYALAKKYSKQTAKKSKKKKTKKDLPIVFSMKIIGDAECVRQTNSALAILQKKSPGDYEKTVKNIGVVECAEKGSGVSILENPPRFKVGRATYQADPFWFASALIHESCHTEEYRNYLSSRPGERVPPEIFSGADAENECLLAQYNCLARLGASQSLLDYTKKIAATNYWDISYEKRWW